MLSQQQTPRPKVLIYDPESNLYPALAAPFAEHYRVDFAPYLENVVEQLMQSPPDVLLYRDASRAPTGLLDTVRSAGVDCLCIPIVESDDQEIAFTAMKRGAETYVCMPVHAQSLALVVDRALAQKRLETELGRLEEQTRYDGINIPGSKLEDIEKMAILRTLAAVDGSTGRAAKMLGISVRKIQYRLRDWRETNPSMVPESRWHRSLSH